MFSKDGFHRKSTLHAKFCNEVCCSVGSYFQLCQEISLYDRGDSKNRKKLQVCALLQSLLNLNLTSDVKTEFKM